VEWVSRHFGIAEDVPQESYVCVQATRALRRPGASPRPTGAHLVLPEENEVDAAIEPIQ
ncbi:hypothetical protein KI387_004271, partial [Taxus chinensis]